MSPDTCVVVPTIRNHEVIREYVENARGHGHADRLFVLLVTEDFCDTAAMSETLDDLDVDGAVYDGAAREAWFRERGLESYADLIPAASHAQTSFGLLYLWAGDFEFGVFLDDDTRPRPDADFFGRHYANLALDGEVRAVGSESRWVNVLHENFEAHGLYPRGYPYGAMGGAHATGAERVDRVVASQGLWTDVPDLDAVRILMDGNLRGQADTRLAPEDYDGEFVTRRGDYLTVCSMNLAFRREVVPAFYQLPMDDNPWEVGRFDDIWSGVFLKRAADLVGDHVVSGRPLCRHEKAPRSTFGDLASEAPALELNEHLWRVVDDAGAPLDDDGPAAYAAAYRAMADALCACEADWRNAEFLPYVGERMHRWLDCLAALDGVDADLDARTTATADD